MITQEESKQLLEDQFDEINRFMNIPGMKKYVYAFAKRMDYNDLVLRALPQTHFREKSLYETGQTSLRWHSIEHYSDKLISILDEIVRAYTFKNMDWGKKQFQNRSKGTWTSPVDPADLSKPIVYVGFYKKRRRSIPVKHYYSGYFFLNTIDSMVYYDIKKKKMVRVSLTKGKIPMLSELRDTKETLKRVLAIRDVDVRKNFLKQLPFDYMKYAKVQEENEMYALLVIEFDAINPNRRVYLKMKNPSTGETHVEAVHPDCRSIVSAINYRRYGEQGFRHGSIGLPSWMPVQLS